MLAKALKTFSGRYGVIRSGTTFNCEPGYLAQLKKNKLAIEAEAEAKGADPGPTRNRSIPRAPNPAGKVETGNTGGTPEDTDPLLAGGKGPTSSSLRADLVSRKKTSPRSVGGVTSKSITKKTPSTPPVE